MWLVHLDCSGETFLGREVFCDWISALSWRRRWFLNLEGSSVCVMPPPQPTLSLSYLERSPDWRPNLLLNVRVCRCEWYGMWHSSSSPMRWVVIFKTDQSKGYCWSILELLQGFLLTWVGIERSPREPCPFPASLGFTKTDMRGLMDGMG